MAASVSKSRRAIDFSKLKFAKKPLSVADSIKDVVPVQWSKEVYSGSAKVTMTYPKNQEAGE